LIEWYFEVEYSFKIQARIGIRVIAEHHLALHENIDGYSGIINHELSPQKIVIRCYNIVKELCEMNYGSSPIIEIEGDIDTKFPYIDVHLEYMMMELLKNSFRATVEHSRKINRIEDPPVVVNIGQGKDDVTIRIRDLGGGIDPKIL
jgi:signal transduction histidine kinase